MENIHTKKEQLKELLKIHYGFEKFRLGQEKAIDKILEGRSCVIIMPTGGGKSLCFQLPALVLEGTTIVISPLIALMKDQVDNLTRLGIPATFINSAISAEAASQRLAEVKNGNYKLLYIAPERFYSKEFSDSLTDLKVSLFAIDEAHCISQWGHDFRPSYLKLKMAIEKLNFPPVLALTATATPEVRQDIIKQLNLKNPEIIITGFSRPNLQFGVIHARETQKPEFVIDAISTARGGAGIIYVGTRSRVDELTHFLLERDIEAVSYHAGMLPEDRKWVQENFMGGKAKVIVATNAFGLGIDKPDIRFVIHYDMPGTVEAYYQEAGRAGRDGKPSFCLMLYNSRDRGLQEFFIKGDNPPPGVIYEVYDALLNFNSDTVLITYGQLSEMISETVPDMAIGTVLKILEREGYIQRSREKSGSAFLRLIGSYENALKCFTAKSKKQIELFNKLYARSGNELNKGWNVNLEEVAELIGTEKESLQRMIRKLSEFGNLEYQPPFRGTEIKILKRVNACDLQIDIMALKEKLKVAYAKLDKIENYIYHPFCRQKFILDYFGDANAKNCGKCDSCLTGAGYIRKAKPPQRKKYFNHQPKDDNFEIEAPNGKAGLNTKLTQLETLDLFKNGFSIAEMAESRNLTEETIVKHIIFLVEKKIIKKEEVEKFVPKNIQNRIMKAAQKVGFDKLRPIFDELNGEVSYSDIRLTLTLNKK